GLCRQGLEDGHEPIRYSLRGSVYSIIRVNLKPALNTEILTPPSECSFTTRKLRFFDCFRLVLL
ncbi:hypothetical protein ACUHMQ_21205, partial [Chitinimonas sp. PSY-7]|uniref:hypothetical protein n=1 Tax=Chitinimonas sp. PSY-7 TaxID=3459088 RepID=UPI00403FD35F